MSETVHRQVREYYEGKLKAHGHTPAGVDWNSQASQELRFERLAELWGTDSNASVLDFGCGYGAMLAWLRGRGFAGPYVGFDLSSEMIDAATAVASQATLSNWAFTADRTGLAAVDYVVASGIFNVRMDRSDREWHDYILATLDEIAALAGRGFAFNALTSYSDRDRRRPDLYYADPLELFDHCKRRHSQFVALHHDYPLYEFTLLVTYP